MPPPRPSEATLLRTAKVVAATGVAIEIVGRDGLTYRIKPVAGIQEKPDAATEYAAWRDKKSAKG